MDSIALSLFQYQNSITIRNALFLWFLVSGSTFHHQSALYLPSLTLWQSQQLFDNKYLCLGHPAIGEHHLDAGKLLRPPKIQLKINRTRETGYSAISA